MKILTIICNVILIGFTIMVLLTDGLPQQIVYVVLALLLFYVPILNIYVISRLSTKQRNAAHPVDVTSQKNGTMVPPSRSTGMIHKVAVVCNFALLAFACWAFADQYPHPQEPGLIEYILAVLLTPIISAIVIYKNRPHVQ